MQRYPVLPLAVFVSRAQLCLPAVQITWIFIFFSILLYDKATAQLQECEKCEKLGSRLAGSGACCERVGGRAVLHRQLLLVSAKKDHVLRRPVM